MEKAEKRGASSGDQGHRRGGRGQWRGGGGHRGGGDRGRGGFRGGKGGNARRDGEDGRGRDYKRSKQGDDVQEDEEGAVIADATEEKMEEEFELEAESDEDESPKTFFTEEQLGIRHYATRGGFGLLDGKLKSIPQDFFVNEMDKSGKIIELLNPVRQPPPSSSSSEVTKDEMTALAAVETTAVVVQEEKPDLDAKIEGFRNDVKVRDAWSPTPSLNEADYVQIRELIESEDKKSGASVTLSTAIKDKTLRGFVHQTLRKHLHPLVTSKTSEDQRVVVQKATREILRQDQRRSRGGTTPNRPQHLEFVLRKTNVDSSHCISELARVSKYPRKSFAVGGTKDKRAVTTQKISLRFASMATLTERCHGRIPCGQEGQFFEIGDVKETEDSNFLGNLTGNRFTIALRNLKKQDPEIPLDLSEWAKGGFINYFGLQRFGTAEVGTHQVGVALMNRDYAAAVDLLLKPRKGEDDKLTEIRTQYASTNDLEFLSRNLPHRCTAERSVVGGLRENKTDLWRALQRIPRNNITMYLHAVQSFVWNHVASKRISVYGSSSVLIGDTVQGSDGNVVLVKSEEEAAKYKMKDVVLALPGHQVIMPALAQVNAMVYDQLLKSMGVANGLVQVTDGKLAPKELQLTGSYRNVLTVPGATKYRLVKYDETSPPTSFFTPEGHFPAVTEFTSGSKEGLLLSFQLPAGTYATMAIRELLNTGVEVASSSAQFDEDS